MVQNMYLLLYGPYRMRFHEVSPPRGAWDPSPVRALPEEGEEEQTTGNPFKLRVGK